MCSSWLAYSNPGSTGSFVGTTLKTLEANKNILGYDQGMYLYIPEVWKFDLWHLDLVENNIPVLHSLSPLFYGFLALFLLEGVEAKDVTFIQI